MAEKGDVFPCRGRDDGSRLVPWQKVWLGRHRQELMRRLRTMDVIEHLIPGGSIDPDMDVYQRIRACPKEMRNERARLLLDFVALQTQAFFWVFQAALADTGCGHLAVGRDDEQVLAQAVSVRELSLVSVNEENCPPAVVKLTSKLKKRYRAVETPALGAEADSRPVSLDEIKVNICLLSADKLDALCGCPAQKQPFAVSALNTKAASVVSLKDVFEKDENGRVNPRQVATGIAGSGKTMAFMLKAPYHWSHEDPSMACWQHIQLFFTINLAKPVWWNAQDLKEVFGLSRFRLTEKEKDDVVEFICDRSEDILLVADSMDEADVKIPSLLWDVLSGSCEDLPRLNVVICSRPCERTSWLSKHSLFHRRLEVVGFTEEKIGQFVSTFFRDDEQKARELQAKLVEQIEVFSLMHTPLLATMICRLHQLKRMLPKTQTGVYEAAVLAMLEQSARRSGHKTPSSIFAELSPPGLQTAVVNLSKMAYEGLSKKQVMFTETEVKSAGCLGAALELGFLSLSPGVNIPGHGEDAFTFQHHTMTEFFAAVHAVRQYIRPGKKSVAELLEEHGTDGDYERFWPFVSGLLTGEECETFLSSLARLVDGDDFPLKQQRLLILLRCYGECLNQLPDEGSQAVYQTMETIGLNCNGVYLGAGDAQAVSTALRRYKNVVTKVSLSSSVMDDSAMSTITTALLSSENLRTLYLDDAFASSAGRAPTFARIIVQNKTSLRHLRVPVDDLSVQIVAPAIMECTEISALEIGSQSLTSESAPVVADILHHHRQLTDFGLQGRIDEEGFTAVAPRLQDMAAHLSTLSLFWTNLSGAILGSALSSLTNLAMIRLLGNAIINDDGLHQLVSHLHPLSALKDLLLLDSALTWKSIGTLERLQHRMVSLSMCCISLERSSLPFLGEDPAAMLELNTMKFADKSSLQPAFFVFGLEITELITFSNDDRQQLLHVFLQ